MHSTNYVNTFIEIAPDSPIDHGEVPPEKAKKTVANYQFEMISQHPYQYTSDDVIFEIFAIRNDVPKENYDEERTAFFSKGQPCLRSSPLTKRYGWGVHHDQQGKIAIYPANSEHYQKFVNDNTIKKTKAMKSKR